MRAYEDPPASPAWRAWNGEDGAETVPHLRVLDFLTAKDIAEATRAEEGPECLYCGRNHPNDGRHERSA